MSDTLADVCVPFANDVLESRELDELIIEEFFVAQTDSQPSDDEIPDQEVKHFGPKATNWQR